MKAHFYKPQKLKGISALIWEHQSDIEQKWKILPEFNINLIFNLGDPWTIHSPFYKDHLYNPTDNDFWLSGLHTKPIYAKFPFARMFGIQLNTIAAEMVFGIPCEELKNWSFDGKEILRKDFYYILDHIREAPDFHTRARWLESYIYKKVSDQGDFHLLQKISSVLDKLPVESGKDIAIEDLTGYSRMHTFRLFKKWYGTSPSEAVNFKRFIHALQHMHHSGVSLTEIGLRCGYYDQSHFIRDFKQYAEMVPSQYLQNKSFVLGQINIDQLDFDMLH